MAENASIPDVPALAASYRRLVLWFGAQLVFLIGARLRGMKPNATPVDLPSTLVFVAYVTITVALLLYTYRTARALRYGTAVLWAFAMLLPCVNVLILLVLSARATNACREHGIPVGVLGPRIARD